MRDPSPEIVAGLVAHIAAGGEAALLDTALRSMLETCPVPQSLYDFIAALPEGDAA